MRKVHSVTSGQVTATIYKDTDWGEYVVKYRIGNSKAYTPESTWFHTGDYEDALATAKFEVEFMDKREAEQLAESA